MIAILLDLAGMLLQGVGALVIVLLALLWVDTRRLAATEQPKPAGRWWDGSRKVDL